MLLLLVVLPLFKIITNDINATAVTTIKTMLKDMKVKFSRTFLGRKLNRIRTHPLYAGCQKGVTTIS